MADDHALMTEEDGLLVVTLNRPEKLNAISPQIHATLWDAARAFADRDDLRCLLITARGRYFSAGVDLNAPRDGGVGPNVEGLEQPGYYFRRNYRARHLLYDEFESIEKPIVLAAQATCLGAGTELAVSCDFRFCTPQAEWGLPEIQLGVIAGSGGSSRLTRLVGPAWAKYLAMAGKRISAERALSIGLVQDIFPEETFQQDVREFCRHVMSLPAEAVGLAKLSVDLAMDIQDRGAQRNLDRVVNTLLIGSPENMRRVEQFTAKRGK